MRPFPRSVQVAGPYAFVVVWSDGRVVTYRLADLQRHCPCRVCAGRAPERECRVEREVRGLTLRSVGRYGIKIEFAEGCSQGIYAYDFLSSLVDGQVT